MVDLLEEYIARVTSRLDAPKAFIEASAYNLVSSLLGRYFRCSFIPGTPNIGFRPNTWFLLSSIPARTRRSTVVNYSNHVYKEVLTKHILSTVHDITQEEVARERVDDTIIEEGSPEGIMDHISITEEYTKAYAIISSEFGSVLSNIQNKDYQKGVSTLLSKLYYGESGTVMLSQRGKDKKGGGPTKRHIPEGLYVTMFAAMQEPKYYLSPIMVGQGLMRRIILLYIKSSDMSMVDWKSPLDERSDVYQEFGGVVEKFGNVMSNFQEMTADRKGRESFIDTVFVDREFINNIARKHDEALLTDESYYNIYMQGYWEHLTKISMLHAIACSSFDDRNGLLKVRREDIRKANDFLERAMKYGKEAIDNLGSIEVTEKDITSVINKVYNRIKSHPEGVARAVLYRELGHIPSEDLTNYISQLFVQERITINNKDTAGRPAIIYKINKQ